MTEITYDVHLHGLQIKDRFRNNTKTQRINTTSVWEYTMTYGSKHSGIKTFGVGRYRGRYSSCYNCNVKFLKGEKIFSKNGKKRLRYCLKCAKKYNLI